MSKRYPQDAYAQGVAQALEAGKLFHIDLNGPKPSLFDQDLRFRGEDQKGASIPVKLLEDARWTGGRHFDRRTCRTEDEQGVTDFAYYSMPTYLISKSSPRDRAGAFEAHELEVARLSTRGLEYERLDPLTTEVLLGVR